MLVPATGATWATGAPRSSPTSRYQGGVGSLDAAPVPPDSPAGPIRFRIEWPRRTVQWDPAPPIPAELSDVGRIVLSAPPSDVGWLRALRRAGLLSASETLQTLRRRRQFQEQLEEGATKAWIDSLREWSRQHAGALVTAVGGTAVPTDTTVLTTRFNTLRTRIREDLDTLADPPAGIGQIPRGTYAALRESLRASAARDGVSEANLTDLRAAADKLVNLANLVAAPDALSTRTDLTEFKEQACALLRPSVVATYDVVWDELFPEADRLTRVIDFDYETGYVGRSDDYYYVNAGDQVFVRVHGVPRGQAVAVSWNEQIVSTTRSERGLDGMGFAPDADATTNPDDDHDLQLNGETDDDGDVASALVLRLGVVDTGRYLISVCRGETTTDCERSGLHELIVQGARRFGLRAGFGVGVLFGVSETRARRVSDGAYFVERYDRVEAMASLPVLATWYIKERQLQRGGVDFGVAAGVNLLRPHREYYLGLHLGGESVGAFLGYAMLRSSLVDATPNDFLSSPDGQPNLGALYGHRTEFDHGIMASVTFDFDVFRRIYRAISSSGVPAIGAGAGAQ